MYGPHERQSLEPGTAWWTIHVSRYLFAVPRATGQRTLDVACGTGYGLALLHAAAREVVGVELDFDAARQATIQAPPSVKVIAADGCSLPFPDASFDLVTSFETLEHLEDRDRFLRELRRVLVTDGLLILSTPNANYTMPVNGKPRNPFHVHEYTPEELREELARYFAGTELLGQSVDARFKISPFEDDQQRLPRTVRMQAKRLVWRILNRLPWARDPVSYALWGHSFLPSASDYQFCASLVDTAPVLVAVCRALAPNESHG